MKNPDLQSHITIKGARTNNLKNIDVAIPKNKLVVVTGLSGSGKSSLIMDTLYAEGQRRYVESMSSYARQFLGRMKKPEVDYIKGIAPAIAIEQRVGSSNARSTVGTLTEIYDYLRLLFAKVGKTISPVSGQEVSKQRVEDVVNFILTLDQGTKVKLLAPLVEVDGLRTVKKELELLLQKGYTRIVSKGELIHIDDYLNDETEALKIPLTDWQKDIEILIDRFVVSEDTDNISRITDSINTAFYEGHGECIVELIDGDRQAFNNRFEADDIKFVEPTPQLFNYNNPYGACKTCEGYGRILGLDPNKIIPDHSKSIYDNAIACWKSDKHSEWKNSFIMASGAIDFPVHKPYSELSNTEKEIVWNGKGNIPGINQFFDELQQQSYKIQNRITMARYRGRTVCPSCHGGRLRKEACYVKIDDRSIDQLINLPIGDLKDFFDHINLTDYQAAVAKRILIEINTRLGVMCDIGLSYLTLDRTAGSLSGGETQRISLTRTLGSNLTSSLYILDEPSIGLHPRDTAKLVEVLKRLRNMGNTVIVIEHEEEIIKQSDFLIDVGPLAGSMGGEIVYTGIVKNLSGTERSLTMQYLQGLKEISLPHSRRKKVNSIKLLGARHHNLKNIDVEFPLHSMTVVAGVSGSGKSTLIQKILYPGLLRACQLAQPSDTGQFDKLSGDIKLIKGVEFVSQNAIGRSARSNPITYVKAYDEIRKLMVKQPLAKMRGYQPRHFSFNTEGGRCETCNGDGLITVEMQFLADVKLICEDCRGQRFKDEILDIKFDDHSIFDILSITVTESLDLFAEHPRIIKKLQALEDVGLGYVKLGQASSTLSGGEAQRLKLASYLGQDKSLKDHVFIFDEPTTGLHFDDVRKLLAAFQALIEQGHTVIVVEHNLDVIKTADWVIDLGPEGGHEGGQLLYQGQPEGLIHVKNSYTGRFIKEKLTKA